MDDTLISSDSATPSSSQGAHSANYTLRDSTAVRQLSSPVSVLVTLIDQQRQEGAMNVLLIIQLSTDTLPHAVLTISQHHSPGRSCRSSWHRVGRAVSVLPTSALRLPYQITHEAAAADVFLRGPHLPTHVLRNNLKTTRGYAYRQ